MAKEKITGAMAVRRAFEAEGVEYLFGMPGGTILPKIAKAFSELQDIGLVDAPLPNHGR